MISVETNMGGDLLFDVECAWCGTVVGQSTVEGSHSICPECYRQVMGVPNMTYEDLNALPFGVIGLDAKGKVVSYNRAEEVIAGRHAEDVVGRNFFEEVAPCTKVREFHGRFQEFMAGDEESKKFFFTFRFEKGNARVQIIFVRGGAGCSVAVNKIAF